MPSENVYFYVIDSPPGTPLAEQDVKFFCGDDTCLTKAIEYFGGYDPIEFTKV